MKRAFHECGEDETFARGLLLGLVRDLNWILDSRDEQCFLKRLELLSLLEIWRKGSYHGGGCEGQESMIPGLYKIFMIK